MKGRSLLGLTISLTILCTCSLAVFAKSRQTTQGLRDNNYPSNSQAQSRRIQFQICSESQSWVRPTETEQIARLKSLPRYVGHEVNSRFWTDNIFLFTSYGLSARHEPTYLSGLWKIPTDTILKCYEPQGGTKKINDSQLAEVWLLQHKVIRIEWQDNRYVMVVAPVEKGVQFIQFPRVERQFPLILKVVAENGTELASLSAPGSPIVTARLLRVKQATGNSQMITWPQTVAQQPKSQLITWREFVEQGGGRYIQVDYDLPPEFRNGYVYFNQGASLITAYILKEGLSSYPPVNVGGLGEIDRNLGDKYLKSGKAIVFEWNLGNSGLKYANDTQVRFTEKGTGCFRTNCLTAPFMTNEQISRILRSKRRIQQKN